MSVEIFNSLVGLSSAIVFITAYLKKKFNTTGNYTIIVSLCVGEIISAIGWALNLGIFIGLEWYYIIIYGLSATLIANGLSTYGFINDLLILLKLKVPKE
ncbi:MAG: hypothetical protein ACOYWZ_07355 [Bacillota bacterium]